MPQPPQQSKQPLIRRVGPPLGDQWLHQRCRQIVETQPLRRSPLPETLFERLPQGSAILPERLPRQERRRRAQSRRRPFGRVPPHEPRQQRLPRQLRIPGRRIRKQFHGPLQRRHRVALDRPPQLQRDERIGRIAVLQRDLLRDAQSGFRPQPCRRRRKLTAHLVVNLGCRQRNECRLRLPLNLLLVPKQPHGPTPDPR